MRYGPWCTTAALIVSFSCHVHAHEPNAVAIGHGRYLIVISGCNDCHTAGYAQAGGEIPESQWLMGDSIGWRGPWGTTYPANLRLYMDALSEDQWLETARTLKTRPPMPWPSIRAMNEVDLRTIYQYIRSLGPAGELMPAFVPPGREPITPYFILAPQQPVGARQRAATTE
jgi:mono/diheme cytochrome c family protein